MIVIAEAVSGFVDVAAVAEEFGGTLHTQVVEPVAGFAADSSLEEALEYAHRDAADSSKRRHGVTGFVGEFGPVLDEVEEARET